MLWRARSVAIFALIDDGQCCSMHVAVLTDLERREVEPERRHLPAELGDLAPGDPAQAVGDEPILDLRELDIEGVGVVICAGARTRLAGQYRACTPQALRDEPEPLPVRLIREAPAELPVGLWQLLRVSGEPRRKRFRDPLVGRRGRHGLHQPQRDSLVAVQHVVRLDPQRVGRQLRGDGRVAVPIAADP